MNGLRAFALSLAAVAGVAAAPPDLSYPPPGEAPVRLAPGQDNPGIPLDPAEAARRAARHFIIGPDFELIRPEVAARAGVPGRARAPRPASAAPATRGPPLLWRVSRPRLKPSYLFGTLHVEDPRVLDLPRVVTRHLRAARRLVTEVRLDPEATGLASTAMLFSDGRTLEQVAGAELTARALPLLEAAGLPRRTARLLQPWAAMLILSRPPARSGEFLDRRLARLAREAGLPATGLETLEEQIAVFRDLALADQLALLREAVENRAGLEDDVENLIRAYLAGDLEALARQALAGTEQGARRRLRERLLAQRNRIMLRRLKPHLREGGAFVAVGALHLAGNGGLLAALRRQGYRVERVR